MRLGRSMLAKRRRNKPVPKDYALSPQLLLAVTNDDLKAVADLTQNPAVDVNVADYEGRTALHLAAKQGSLESVKMLVSQGAQTNIPDHTGRAPIMEAKEAGAEEVVRYLRSHGAIDSSKFMARKSGLQRSSSMHSLSGMSDDSTSPMGNKKPVDIADDKDKEMGAEMAPGIVQKVVVLMSVPFIVLLLLQGSWYIFLFVLLSFMYFYTVGAYLVSEVSIRPPWYTPTPNGELTRHGIPEYWQGIFTNPQYDLNLEYDNVEFPNNAGHTLRGWWVPVEEGQTDVAVVMVHGGGRDRRAWLRHVQMFHQEGFPCLLFDLREHGVSDGTCRGFSYGAREKYDVLAAARWAREIKGVQKVVILGTSVGGSSVIMAAAEDANMSISNPSRPLLVDLCISENPPAVASELQSFHLRSAVYHYAGGESKMHFAAKVLLNLFDSLACLFLKIRIGVFPGGTMALDVVGSLRVPLLLMHGTGDDVVPHQDSERLFQAAKEPKELWMAADAFHCGLYDRYPQDFRQRVFTFMRRHLSGIDSAVPGEMGL